MSFIVVVLILLLLNFTYKNLWCIYLPIQKGNVYKKKNKKTTFIYKTQKVRKKRHSIIYVTL